MSMNSAARAEKRRICSTSHSIFDAKSGAATKIAAKDAQNMNAISTLCLRSLGASIFLALLFFASPSHACQLIPLDANTVTTGGVAVQALNAGHRGGCVNQFGGGWLQNPPTATINMCISENGVASGTTSNVTAGVVTTCIAPAQTYTLTANAGPVSVITSDSAHPFVGYGWQP